MKIQKNAVNVLERTSAYLRAGLLTKQPAWYNVVASVPPLKKFERVPKLTNPSNDRINGQLHSLDSSAGNNGMFKTRYTAKDRSNASKQLYSASKLTYIEDQLREIFYKQHPWELSRPKILIENNGDEKYDWSHMQQIGKPLDGESVVQRTLYLMKNKEAPSLVLAYDMARYEFYRLRMQQHIEEQVAQEEAEMFGSVFGPSAIEYGIQKEQKVIDTWKRKAIIQTEIMAARRINPSESWATDEKDPKKNDDIEEDVEEIKL
ncbi:hypothetical protein Kpol_1003p40 [Vanderwaltozyma polyspora DSM 70294]|uniref:Small ribosomal subunit protein mS23 n=1 Tax=Vanderwaltozyma polyspora (strain ATCC 22028 / DSM 70294 / BCRC 21397 / CBS 2163 / NBRC 10782 / NRRL Y-8283 / UCD 57-17) TaxID=436907 RepID=RT25_VANPO|nr:uncharacterized protein Kpol_1003p40 [Vanderwaltozyma polyspora DSM 70294]A7TLZ8.1 RecName: Full=Small ribosomal subunit protein mS23; AltName: Full=37S ribosomal protein S25, mitochondrial [Vanderwaltozyma polyspora DSM 70294]EDO16735.1 hypothetical protein Kpol_1003p40 [Vanderwaltozyma polyspora DSM 70294]